MACSKIITVGLLWLFAAASLASENRALRRFEFERVEMAIPVRIVLYAPDEPTANRAAEAAFGRIRQLNGVLSDYDPNSELRRLCDTAGSGRAVVVSDDLWRVLLEAQRLAKQTDGAFDVTVGPVVRLWRRARRTTEMPHRDTLDAARQLVGYRLARLDPQRQTVELLKADMRLDLGGIAKGFVIDEALKVLARNGVTRALVDAGGDIVLGEAPPDKSGWRIGIARLNVDGPPTKIVSLARASIATSGDSWQFVEIGGRRYSHIVDPKTGLGLTDHSSVTIVAPNAMVADSLASAVSVLGPKRGIELIEKTPGTAAFIVRAPQGKVETYQSSRWKDLPEVSAKP